MGQQCPPDNRAAGCSPGLSVPPWSSRPRCRGCSRAPPGPAWAPEVSGARPPAVTPCCSGAAAASPQTSCRWAAPFSPAPHPRLHPLGLTAGYWGLDPGPRPSARPPEPAGGRGQGRCLARPVLLLRFPKLGRSHSPDLLRTPGFRAPAGTAALARAGCCGPRETDPSTPGRR